MFAWGVMVSLWLFCACFSPVWGCFGATSAAGNSGSNDGRAAINALVLSVLSVRGDGAEIRGWVSTSFHVPKRLARDL